MTQFFRYISIAGVLFVPTFALAATFSLSSLSGTYGVGETFSVGVYLNTEGKESVGGDLEVLYPSGLLEVVDANAAASGVQITPGVLMPQNQLNTASLGRARFAQLVPVGQSFSNTTNALFATINFRVLASGTGLVSVEFTPGNTRDSNVAALGGIDLLSGVTNASFNLGGDGASVHSFSSFIYTRNLKLGSRGEDVRQLQKFLNELKFTIAISGSGSPGNETDYFGNLTKQALIRFQEAYAADILAPVGLIRGSGYFGPSTRTKIQLLSATGLLIGSSGQVLLPPPSPQSVTTQSLQQQINQARQQLNLLLEQLQTTQGQ